jgi:octaprenyl-diphosphate synthase
MTRATQEERGVVREVIERGGEHRLDEILAIVRRTGALQATREAAQAEAEAARQALAVLPPSRAREALLELSIRAVHRSS